MNPFLRAQEIIRGVSHAFRFDNPIEYLLNWHVLRRRDPFILRHSGFLICVNAESSDAHAVLEVLIHGMYDDAIREAAAGRRNFSYLNLGGNIGTFDIRVAQLVRLPTYGLAVEMNPFAHARLLLNLELNHLYHIHTLNAGASKGPGSAHIPDTGRNTGQQLPSSPSSEGRLIPLVGWRDVIGLFGADKTVDLLKVEIEGSEAAFLEGFSEHARRHVRRIVMESHGPENCTAVKRFLQDGNFVVTQLRPTGSATHLFAAKNLSLA